MGLNSKEKSLLEKLKAKAELPDIPAAARNLDIKLDLGDAKQVAMAVKLGLLGNPDDDTDDADDTDTEGDIDKDDKTDPPKRTGFFREK